MAFFHNPVDMTDGRAHKERKDERHNIMSMGPNIDIYGIEDQQEGEAPRNAVDDDPLSRREELVDDVSEQQQMNHGPNVEGVRCSNNK